MWMEYPGRSVTKSSVLKIENSYGAAERMKRKKYVMFV